MDRPRRSVRPPGALSDFLTTTGEVERRPAAGAAAKEREEEAGKQEQQGKEEETGSRREDQDETEEGQGEADDKLLLSQPYKCRECKARYRSRVALLRHAGKHNGEKPFICSECGKGLSSQCALSEHVNIHTNNRPHRCEECGLESRQLSVHLRHLLTHQARPDRLYTCSVCARTFKQNEYLRRHMRKHTGEKPFTCAECGKSFTCKSELNRHGKRHSSEHPHPCPECGRGFKMQHNLRAHLRAHAGTQQWRCVLCPAVFPKLKLLETHRRSHQESVQHLHISRPDHSTLLVCAAGGDRRRLPTIHPIPLPTPSHAPPSSPTLENHPNPTDHDLANPASEGGIQVNHTTQGSPSTSPPGLSHTTPALKSTALVTDSPTSSVPHSPKRPTSPTPTTVSPLKNVNKKFLRINDTTLPLDLILKSVGKGGAIQVKIIDRPPPRPCSEASPGIGGGCRGSGGSVVELVDGEAGGGKREDVEYEGGGVMGEAMKVEATNVEGEVSGEGSVVEAAGVLGAGDSVLSHCLAPHYTRPAPLRRNYRAWLATLSTFCNQLDPPLDPEVCQCLATTASTLQKCLILDPGSGTSHKADGEVTTTIAAGETLPCHDLPQYQFIHKHYLSVVEALHKHFSHRSNSASPTSASHTS